MAEYQDRFDELNAREQDLILRYEKTLDPYKSAIAAGYERSVARTSAYSWFKQPDLKPAFYETAMARRAKRLEAHHVSAEELKHRTWLIATADPAELVTHVRRGCRHCWGEGFGYQWKEHEFEAAVARHDKDPEKNPLPDWAGGMGYTTNSDPNPECPHCDGKGFEEVHPTDFRDLSEAGRALYKGIKPTKYGYEIMMHDQQAARVFYAQLCGYQIDRKELTGKNGSPLAALPTTITLVAQSEPVEVKENDV
jgi:phage terminase small subunit